MQYAMVAAVLLPVALAALCPCPSPSPEDTVCGSDGRTYASLCELQCAALPGLSVADHGPCATQEVPAGHRQRRYTVEFREWNKCRADRQCGEPHEGNCKECGPDDKECRMMCGWNCACRCAGLPTGGLDEDTYERWEKCYQERGCTTSKRDECKKKCDNEFCRNLCHMDWWRCSCGCVQHVAHTRTSTTTATTASSSPSTTEAVTSTTEVETNSTQAMTSASGTTATVAWTWRHYMACAEQSRDCGRDSFLPEVRRANCTCGCMGLPGSDLEVYGSAAVQTCLADCGGLSCKKLCQKDECHDNCHLRELRCRCECNHRGRATAATSTDTKLKT